MHNKICKKTRQLIVLKFGNISYKRWLYRIVVLVFFSSAPVCQFRDFLSNLIGSNFNIYLLMNVQYYQIFFSTTQAEGYPTVVYRSPVSPVCNYLCTFFLIFKYSSTIENGLNSKTISFLPCRRFYTLAGSYPSIILIQYQ